ncbi:hypothetical protein [Bartonella koehlerae]|uniref:hypothetical protein n=1 Tax=Bartonella koehlerae TaxID=92181 RepID=UPI001ABA2E87|nr:hypothetical protein [Bartonella koehlerae]
MLEAIGCAAGYREDQHEGKGWQKVSQDLTTKNHIMIDILSQALRFLLTSENENDYAQAA